VDAVGTAEKVHLRLNDLLAESRAKQAIIDAAQEAERLKVDAAMAEVIEVVEQVAVVAAVADIVEANDPSGALPELKYARSASVVSVQDDTIFVAPSRQLIYVEADPSSAVDAVDPDRFFEPNYTENLEKMIAHVVESEGPILDVILARRIARAHGWVRTGAKIRDRVDQLAKQRFRFHDESQVGVFYWPTSLKEDQEVVFRQSADEDSLRSLMEICLAEIASIASKFSARTLDDESLIYSIAKEAGVQKLTASVRARIVKAIQMTNRASA
jgi:hypothetical protein